MGQTRQNDMRTELSRPGEPGLTTRMVEKGIQQQHGLRILIWKEWLCLELNMTEMCGRILFWRESRSMAGDSGRMVSAYIRENNSMYT